MSLLWLSFSSFGLNLKVLILNAVIVIIGIQNWTQFLIHLYYNILILSVCTAIDSAPGYHTDMRPVSLDPVWPERGT